MNFTLWNVSKSVELFWRKCIILPVLSAAIYETAPDGRCRCRRRTAPRRIRDAGAAAQSVRRSCRREPAGACRLRRRQRGAHRTPRRAGTPSARRRRALGSPYRNRFCGDGRRCPHPRLVRLRLSARSHGGGNRLVTACVKQQFSGNNSALPLIHQVFAVIVPSASCHAPS